MIWVLGALCLGASLLVLAAYQITLGEINEVFDDSLRQTALLLADRDLAGGLPVEPRASSLSPADTESKLVAIARAPGGSLLFSSQPELPLSFTATPGASVQRADDLMWHVFTVVQSDRIVQVAQPTSVRREAAAESASQLLPPLFILVMLIGALLVIALQRGIQPLQTTIDELAQRSARSLIALDARRVPAEVLPLVRALNDLLHRLSTAFEAQRNFIADAAHELRSPVTALQLQVQVLERSRSCAERTAAMAELSAGVGRAKRLIEQLLHLSRATADDGAGLPLVRQTVRLGDLVRSVVVRWSGEAEGRQIDLGAVADTDAVVEGDPAQLEILLSNLVDNALKYTPRGGIVDVIASVPEGIPTLQVVDNGPGILEDERPRVLDRFYRSPRTVGSTETGIGLGLAIAKAIAEKHGARVSLHTGRNGVGLDARVAFSGASVKLL
jgi:two-component system OmpR family sensor kinase